MLSGTMPGTYVLISPVQKVENLQVFYPFFGFAYNGKATQITVTLLRNGGTSTVLTPQPYLLAFNGSWNYFSKNLTTIISNWPVGQEWQASRL
jgi:hypothetical protein